MAAPSYTTDLIDWIADNDTTAWTELTNALSGGAPDEVDTESALQGTNTVSQTTNTTSLCSMARILGASTTFASGQVALVWHGHGVATALESYANNGLRVVFTGNAVGNWKSYTVAGGDVAPFPYGKWINSAVDPSLTPDATNGTPPTGGTSIFGIGSMCQLTLPVARGQPHVCDIIRYGRAEARMNGGDLTNGYATFAGFAAVNDTQTNRWGLIQATTGGYLWKGLMVLGHTTAVDFRTSNVNVFVQDCRKVSSSFNRIEIRQAGSRVDWTNVTFLNASPSTTASKGQLEVVDNADVNIDGCTFVDMDTFIFQANSTVVGSTFRRCGQITLGGGSFTDCLFANSTAASSVAASSLNLLDSCSFVSDGSNHAVDLGTVATSTTMNWNSLATGYAVTDGTTGNETILVNVAAGQTLTINVAAGATTPSIRNTGTGTVSVVAGQVTTEITVIDIGTGDPIADARVYLTAAAGGPLSVGTIIISGLTDSNGKISDIRSLASDQPVTGRVRKSSTSPFYKTSPIVGTIDNAAGLSLTIQMIRDE